MTLISQLAQRITPLILNHSSPTGDAEPTSEQALLEQFYALVAVRLTEAPVQQRLSGASPNTLVDDLSAEKLFAQLWPAASDRQTLVDELADSYYMTAPQTVDLVHTALPLLYSELQHLSRQQRLSLTELLTPQLAVMRAYIAPWAAPLLSLEQTQAQAGQPGTNTVAYPVDDYANDQADDHAAINALHASPADEHADHNDARLQKVRKRPNKRILLIVTLLLGLLILAGLAWLAFNYYQQQQVTDPVVTTPVVPAVAKPPVSTALTPAKLVIKMDLGQSLYECQATVGNAQLEASLFNTLTTVLGEQARQCVVTIDANTATEMPSLPSLAGILSVIQPVAFATLELQDNTLSLSAPDPNALNQMIMQIQSIAPALTIRALDPIVPAGTNANGMTGNNEAMDMEGNMPANSDPNAMNNPMDMGANTPNMPSNNNSGYAGNEGAYDNGGMPNYEQNIPAAPPANNNSDMNNGSNYTGTVSENELNDLANMNIYAEPAQGGRPIRSVE